MGTNKGINIDNEHLAVDHIKHAESSYLNPSTDVCQTDFPSVV